MKRLLAALNAADRVVLIFCAVQTVLGFVSGNEFSEIALLLVGNLVIAAFVLLIAYRQSENYSRGWSIIHLFYPIALNIWFYPRSCEFRFGLFKQDLDPLLVQLDGFFFANDWHRILPEMTHTGFLEYFHGIYFLYYLALIIFPWIVLKEQNRRVRTYVYTLTMTMAIHHIFIMLFPATGPVGLRAELMPEGWLFIPIMNWIYGNLDAGGGGAFPSLHVAASMILYYFSLSFFPRQHLFLSLFAISVIISTIAGSFHYSIDALAGIVTGTLAFIFIPDTYRKMGSFRA